MVDIFEEVDEQLRSDRLAVLARRYLPWIGGVLALALAIALGFWAYSSHQEKNIEAASQAYADGLDKLGQGDFDAAYAKFGQAAEKPTPGYQALALMQQAGVRMDQKRVPEAVALFDKAAAATSNPVSSLSSRKAASAGVSPGSASPLGMSHRGEREAWPSRILAPSVTMTPQEVDRAKSHLPAA